MDGSQDKTGIATKRHKKAQKEEKTGNPPGSLLGSILFVLFCALLWLFHHANRKTKGQASCLSNRFCDGPVAIVHSGPNSGDLLERAII
jgi:hypothetical protein